MSSSGEAQVEGMDGVGGGVVVAMQIELGAAQIELRVAQVELEGGGGAQKVGEGRRRSNPATVGASRGVVGGPPQP